MLPMLENKMREAGFSDEEIEKVFYKNVLRVFKEVLKQFIKDKGQFDPCFFYANLWKTTKIICFSGVIFYKNVYK